MLQDKRWLLLDCKNKTPAQRRPGASQLRAAMRSSFWPNRKCGALIDCAYQLNPHYNRGAIDQFLIRYEPGRPEVSGDFAERRKPHFDRAVKLTDGKWLPESITFGSISSSSIT